MRTLLALWIVACSLGSLASAQSRLLGIEGPTPRLFEIDPLTGDRTLIGALIGHSSYNGAMAWDASTSTLYFTSLTNDELWTLDPDTRVCTRIGSFNTATNAFIHGIEFDPTTGILYGKGSNPTNGGVLYRIDPLSGQATPIGSTGFWSIGALEWFNGRMYMSDPHGTRLYTLDLSTGAATLVGPFGTFDNVGIEFASSPAHGLLATANFSDMLYRVDPVTGAATLIGPHGMGDILGLEFVGHGWVGTPYCSANPNSTGQFGSLRGFGWPTSADNTFELHAAQLPLNEFGYFLASRTQGFHPNAGGSAGNLCLGGAIGRYVGPGQTQSTGATGTFSLALDLTAAPTPTGPVAVMAGETWRFQAWYRDTVGGTTTSNFTFGLSLRFD